MGPCRNRADQKHRLWAALHADADHRESVRRMDDISLLEPLAMMRSGRHDCSEAKARKLRRENRTSTVVSERVYMALQRGTVRSTLEIDDLLIFVSQVHPLKHYSQHVRRSLCEQACLVRFGEGDKICTQGEMADDFYVILTGAVLVYREPEEAKPQAGGAMARSRRKKRQADRAAARVASEPSARAAAPSIEAASAGQPTSLDAMLAVDDDVDNSEEEDEQDDGDDDEGENDGADEEHEDEEATVVWRVAEQIKAALAQNRAVDTFRKWDKDLSGRVDKEEFHLACQDGLHIAAPRAAFDQLFDVVDRGSDRELHTQIRRLVTNPSHKGLHLRASPRRPLLAAAADAAAPRDEDEASASASKEIPQNNVIVTLQEGDGFGHAALTEDVTARLRGASCRAIHATSCMRLTHEMYLAAQRQEAQRREEDSASGAGGKGGDGEKKRDSLSVQLTGAAAAAHEKRRGSADVSGKSSLHSALSFGALHQRVIAALKAPPEGRTAAQLKLIMRISHSTRFFQALDPADCEQLSKQARARTWNSLNLVRPHMRYQLAHPNAVLMQTGDDADKFYLVLRGSLQVLVNGQVVATKGPADTFGEMALLRQSDEKRSADVISIETCDLATLHRSDYLEIVQRKQNAKMALKRQLIQANPLFGCLSHSQQESFSKCGKLQHFSGGEMIIQQGATSEEIFLILRGSCAVTRRLPFGGGSGASSGTGSITSRGQQVELQVSVLQRGQLFGEIGVLQSVPRTASVVAELSCECFVVQRIELMRLLFDCPELRVVMLEAANRYPADEELLRTWRHDEAWQAYKGALQLSVQRPLSARTTTSQRPRGPSVPGKLEFCALPRFVLTHSARGGRSRGRMDEGSKLHVWANEYLDQHVLPKQLLDGLVVHTEYPKPRPPAGAAPTNGDRETRSYSRRKVSMVG